MYSSPYFFVQLKGRRRGKKVTSRQEGNVVSTVDQSAGRHLSGVSQCRSGGLTSVSLISLTSAELLSSFDIEPALRLISCNSISDRRSPGLEGEPVFSRNPVT